MQRREQAAAAGGPELLIEVLRGVELDGPLREYARYWLRRRA